MPPGPRNPPLHPHSGRPFSGVAGTGCGARASGGEPAPRSPRARLEDSSGCPVAGRREGAHRGPDPAPSVVFGYGTCGVSRRAPPPSDGVTVQGSRPVAEEQPPAFRDPGRRWKASDGKGGTKMELPLRNRPLASSRRRTPSAFAGTVAETRTHGLWPPVIPPHRPPGPTWVLRDRDPLGLSRSEGSPPRPRPSRPIWAQDG